MILSGWATVPPRGRARKGKSHKPEFPSPEQLKEEREPFAASGKLTGRGGGAEGRQRCVTSKEGLAARPMGWVQ